MQFQFNDGGRAAAGFKGTAGDCVARAIVIATGRCYALVYDDLARMMKVATGVRSARNGIPKEITRRLMKQYGWKWVPTMKIGQGCKVHLRADELPGGVVMVQLSRHVATIIDGVLNDTYDCTRDGDRCVYGYWIKQ